jgi:hypothetical protein
MSKRHQLLVSCGANIVQHQQNCNKYETTKEIKKGVTSLDFLPQLQKK